MITQVVLNVFKNYVLRFQKEEIESPRREIEQDRLVGESGAAVPAQPWRDVIDRQRDDHVEPFEPAERAVNPPVEDRVALRVQQRLRCLERLDRFRAVN